MKARERQADVSGWTFLSFRLSRSLFLSPSTQLRSDKSSQAFMLLIVISFVQKSVLISPHNERQRVTGS